VQILAIALYRKGQRRVVRLKPGRLNVVTGWPGTGKSSLLEIVEYCLGRTEPTFARGALDVVDWYGLLVEGDGSRLFIARPAPAAGAQSGHSAMLVMGAADVVEADQLAPNANADTVRTALSALVGIEDNLAPITTTREPQRATVAQALLLCFQGQGEISNPALLFHRTNEPFVGQALKDAFPYLLGAVGTEYLGQRLRLQAVRRELRSARADLADVARVQTETDVRGAALLSLAASVGLATEVGVSADYVQRLRAFAASDRRVVDHDSAPLREEERLRQLRRHTAEELRQVQEARAALSDSRQERGAFQTELREQSARLLSLELVGPVESGARCPLCEQRVDPSDPTSNDLRGRLADLATQLESAQGLEAPRRRIVSQLRERAQELRRTLREVDASLALVTQQEGPNRQPDGQMDAFVRGRIAEFLESLRSASPGHATVLEDRIAELEAEAAALETAMDPLAISREVESRLHFVNEMMSTWAAELELEHSEHGIRLDLANLSLFANERSGPIPLRRIGSAGTQVSYHIVAHLALHQWFIEESRPVPRFILLDQPEQAYYPEEVAASDDPNAHISDLDEQRVRSLYGFINNVTESLKGGLQVIVVGHWNPNAVPWFEDARVENWRGLALVPTAWLDDAVPEGGHDDGPGEASSPSR
jgi:hypothetical protein